MKFSGIDCIFPLVCKDHDVDADDDSGKEVAKRERGAKCVHFSTFKSWSAKVFGALLDGLDGTEESVGCGIC